MKVHGTVELNTEEIDTINGFFDILMSLGELVPDQRTVDVFGYLIRKWAYQYKKKGDATIYLDQIVREEH